MIHHASGPLHSAHVEKLECSPHRVSHCGLPTLPEGSDGKCGWCRQSSPVEERTFNPRTVAELSRRFAEWEGWMDDDEVDA